LNKVAAVYVRKSKATEKGESIENQIQRGKDLCNYKGWSYQIYEDYDVSGKNLDRPSFKKLMYDIDQGMIHTLVCYKLDRVSRSVNDFSTLIDELEKKGVNFVSLKENFDTTTPMGRAMMMITSVFAQLERETIAERVRDNMIDRAKLGKWNGGPIPLGYTSINETVHENNKTKKSSKLIIEEDEASIVRFVYNKYLETKSIRGTAHELNRLGYKTKKGVTWNPNQVQRILKNALYCIGDTYAFNYFNTSTDVQISSPERMFDGAYGLMYYNRRQPNGTTSKQLPMSEWILSVSEHQGIISGKEFATVQLLIKKNASIAPRLGQSQSSPLSGLVKCGECESSMSVYYSRKSNKSIGATDQYYSYFNCIKKVQQAQCDNRSIRTDKLENSVVEYLSYLLTNEDHLHDLLKRSTGTDDKIEKLDSEKKRLKNRLDAIDNEISNLTAALAKNVLPEDIIMKKYNELEKDKNLLVTEYNSIINKINYSTNHKLNTDIFVNSMKQFNPETYHKLPMNIKKTLLRSIIKKVIIYKDSIKIHLFVDLSCDSHVICPRTLKGSCLRQA
jgi:site-specific DNA recombinase